MADVAVISGGASGFGRALADGCAGRGMNVVLLDLDGDRAGTVVFPSGMLSRHLETSEAAQPEQVRRPIAGDDDFTVMHQSNPAMAEFLATPAEAAAGVVDAILGDRPYVITHGEFLGALDTRQRELRAAAIEAGGKSP